MRWRGIPGISLAVVQDGRIVKANGYGLAGVENNIAATAESVYEIGSLSKQFVAAAVLLLAERHRLDLGDPASKYIDGMPDTWKEITVQQLLTHTSGLPRESEMFKPFERQEPVEFVRASYDQPLEFTPGSSFSYSNIGYYVLAEIVTRVAGKPWTAFLSEDLLASNGLRSTFIADPAAIIPNRVGRYTIRNGVLFNAEVWQATRPSGAIASSVLDLARWTERLGSGEVLGPEFLERMFSPAVLTDGTTHPYGLGWFLSEGSERRYARHDGGLPGATSDLEWFLDDSLAIIVLSNVGNRPLRDVAIGVAELYDPRYAPELEPAITESSPAVSGLVKTVLEDLSKSTINPQQFTPELTQWLSQDIENGFGERLQALGDLEALELLSATQQQEASELRYRARYTYGRLLVTVALNVAGVIRRLAIDS
jgi:CubicO group peptidase (beta-lactamase class C family)